MEKLYVYANELLGDNVDNFCDTSNVDCIYADTADECLAKFEADYDSNDYTASFTKHPTTK